MQEKEYSRGRSSNTKVFPSWLFNNLICDSRYDILTLESCLSSSRFQECRLPNCSANQECFPEEDSYIICRQCGGRTCIKCDAVWHPSETCKQYTTRRLKAKARIRKREEKESGRYIHKNTKKCPGCTSLTQKDDGCDHMTCEPGFTCSHHLSPFWHWVFAGRRCKHQYCWICLADYKEIRKEGNDRHREDCKYHSANLPDMDPPAREEGCGGGAGGCWFVCPIDLIYESERYWYLTSISGRRTASSSAGALQPN